MYKLAQFLREEANANEECQCGWQKPFQDLPMPSAIQETERTTVDRARASAKFILNSHSLSPRERGEKFSDTVGQSFVQLKRTAALINKNTSTSVMPADATDEGGADPLEYKIQFSFSAGMFVKISVVHECRMMCVLTHRNDSTIAAIELGAFPQNEHL